jgi:hypothetical protein
VKIGLVRKEIIEDGKRLLARDKIGRENAVTGNGAFDELSVSCC